MNNTTCGYCGSSLGQSPMMKSDKCFCSFCEMFVSPMKDGERLDRLKKTDYISHDHMNLKTPDLMVMHTKSLLHLLRLMREDRRSYFDNMRILKKAANESPEFKDGVIMSAEEYEKITRKCFVVENILNARLGYIPKKITDQFLLSYEERCKEVNRPMIIRRPENEPEKKLEVNRGR